MDDTFEEFRERILRTPKKKPDKIQHSYGVYDYYKYYRKNKPKGKKYILTENTYYDIMRKLNQYLAEALIYEC
jgi:hypothetical protein